ncbi:MAG: hypothetical protein LYZ69_08700 [Nitrososphaerales archaeon]|nr:hypothetical protein [Nitrososphaerales archaeon]
MLSTRLCSSSTTTALRWLRLSLILRPGSTAWSVSGVVTRTSGGWVACLVRCDCGVSPWRISTVRPSFEHQSASLFSMSLLRALIGVM